MLVLKVYLFLNEKKQKYITHAFFLKLLKGNVISINK